MSATATATPTAKKKPIPHAAPRPIISWTPILYGDGVTFERVLPRGSEFLGLACDASGQVWIHYLGGPDPADTVREKFLVVEEKGSVPAEHAEAAEFLSSVWHFQKFAFLFRVA